MVDERVPSKNPSTPLGDLAAAAEHRRDVALTAAGRVEHRADAVRFGLVRAEFRCRVVEAALVVFDPRELFVLDRWFCRAQYSSAKPFETTSNPDWRIGDGGRRRRCCACSD
jgi:hypothetical protein